MNWDEFIAAAGTWAVAGHSILDGHVAYLATIRKDGSPRLHPVTPDFAGGNLYVFMEPTSPKGRDFRRDARYTLHGAVNDGPGPVEFLVTGRAELVTDSLERATAASASAETGAPVLDRYVLFRLAVDSAMLSRYEGDTPVRERWPAP